MASVLNAAGTALRQLHALVNDQMQMIKSQSTKLKSVNVRVSELESQLQVVEESSAANDIVEQL